MRIAIASCAKIQKQAVQPAWKAIEDVRPDLLLLLGDNVYQNNSKWDGKELELRYQQQMAEPNFASLVSKVPRLAIYDDHDFGPNNVYGVGSSRITPAQKEKSRALFHKYMNCAPNPPEIYGAKTFGDVKVILLDERFYRTSPSAKNATVLGATQEEWFRSEMKSPGVVTLICSSSPIAAKDQRLDEYPGFLQLLKDVLVTAPRTLLLSGDIHENQFKFHKKLGLFEVTSSGVGRPPILGGDPLDNYGIIEIDKAQVSIKLSGRRKKDNLSATIRIDSWKTV